MSTYSAMKDEAGAAAEPLPGREPVLVVGAGPVGLALACELLRRGVPVRMVDRHRSTTEVSKAIIVWPRTLELLAGLSASAEMVEAGHLLDGVQFFSGGSRLGSVVVSELDDSVFNHVLMLPQRETERILLARLTELGGVVEWGTEVVKVSCDDADATVLLRHGDGVEETVRTPWLVGADGAHSTVRKQLGIGFDLTSPEFTFAIADAPVEGDVDERMLNYFYSVHGAIGVGPLGGKVFRFAVSVPEGQQPSRELFQQALDQRAGSVGRVGEPKWSAIFTVRCATASSFRSGRAFLIGDAAHVLSPAGGQGLNTGIQDAVNLGWKLAGVYLGLLHPDVLDSYDEERRQAVIRVGTTTDRQTRWGLLRAPSRVVLRDLLVRAAAASGLLQRALAPMFSQTDLCYGNAPGSWLMRAWRYPQVWEGARLPYLAHLAGVADESTGAGASAADVTLPTLILSRGRLSESEWAGARQRLVDAAPVELLVRDLVGGRGTPQGELARLLGKDPAAVLVRPDGHILAVAGADRPERLFARLTSLVTAPAPVPAADGVLGRYRS